ncbi:asparagine synthase (glutamine-hydrolyzing) [candidate division KSB1 bacterium]|nr:asparagine synthase (glutamine-hydrolyzing) [candidate division KSB1 bacterium]
MIFGVLERVRECSVDPNALESVSKADQISQGAPKILLSENFGCFYKQTFKTKCFEKYQPASAGDGSIITIFEGRIYNTDELISSLSDEFKKEIDENPAKLVLYLYRQHEQKFIGKMNGKFAFAIWDKNRNTVILGRDRVGIEPLYYYLDKERLVFSSNIRSILRYPGVKKELNYQALCQFLLFTYNPGLHTFFEQIHKLRPAYLMILRNGDVAFKKYWTLTFARIAEKSEKEAGERLIELLRDAVKCRIESGENLGTFLSGGMDSSTVVALTTEFLQRQLNTFSYRCRGESFDESHYARFMAKHYNTSHHETEYRVEDVLETAQMVKYMDEPFCDVGINVATYILGKQASQFVPYIFTGDGGDELFAGHPVYEADKMAAVVDKIPGFIRTPVLGIARLLPDSDKKKNFIVKAKRFAASYRFPKELLSHRWRIYYDLNELQRLYTREISQMLNGFHPYEDILQFNNEADGRDGLSNSLYSDYHTVVGFYLRRMNLNNKFALEPRYPLLDHRLIDYCATLPSGMKFRGMSETKYIFKKTMETVLPDEIVHRKDKLGHSIPLKNWMRSNDQIKEFIMTYLSEDVLKKRGFFNPDFVQKMIKQHNSKRQNYSHRIWALAVLEMWLQEHLDKIP